MSRLTTAAIVAMLAASPAFAQEPTPSPQIPTIVTTGEAIVKRSPDQAFVTLSVETRAKGARDAQRLNSEAMTSVQQKLTGAGLAKDAIRTTGYSINQEFDFVSGRRVPREFVARNGLEVRIDAVERTGEILETVVTGGATNIAGIRFDIKDRAGAEREALRHAVEDARARADALAAGAGRTVDRVIRIDDTRQMRPSPPVMMAQYSRAAVADAAPPPPPIEAGQVEVQANVTLTVAIK